MSKPMTPRSRIENRWPVAKEGLPFILAFGGAAALLALIGWWPAAAPFVALAGFSLWFFRDPDREPPLEAGVVSPADGRVLSVSEEEDGRFLKTRARKISIFMSVWSVHVNRAPLAGVVEDVRYVPGRFFKAHLEKSSLENEHNAIVLRLASEDRIVFVQIAGVIARRIACWVRPGDEVGRGQRVGLIRFGSRLDVYLPLTARVKVRPGDTVRAGRSILGELS
jgi:phosphatidylserine decarboxylase